MNIMTIIITNYVPNEQSLNRSPSRSNDTQNFSLAGVHYTLQMSSQNGIVKIYFLT